MVLVLMGVVIFDLYLNIYWNQSLLMFSFPLNDNWATKGQWGDILSGHFSALAFLAIIYSILLQRQDIKKMRNDETFKVILQLLKDLDDKQKSIHKIDFPYQYVNTASKAYVHPNHIFEDISKFDEALNQEDYFTDVSIDKLKLGLEILYRLKAFYITIEAIKILVDDEMEKQYIDLINSKIDQYKTTIRMLIKIFIFVHDNEILNEQIAQETTDTTYVTLLKALANIDTNELFLTKVKIMLNEVKNKHLKVEYTK
jgi:hypothetical protein